MAIAAPAVQRTLEIDGMELPPDVAGLLVSVVVDDHLHHADTFELTFRDPDLDVLGRANLRIGSKVKISATSVGREGPELLIAGEVTSIEADYDTAGTRALVRGYDSSHRLSVGRRTETYRNVKDSDIARTVADRAGLGVGTIEDSGSTVEYVLQANQSDLEFLKERAARLGFEVLVIDGALQFKKPTPSGKAPGSGDFVSTDPTQLVWKNNLLEFRARVSAVGQVSEVEVRGWDPVKKEEIVGRAAAHAASAEVGLSPSELADKVGGGTHVVVDRAVLDQSQADKLAEAAAEQIGSAAFEATCVALGSPALKAGVPVSVAGVGPPLDGKWVITHSRHVFGETAYRTSFEVSGRQDRSLPGLIGTSLGGGGSANRVPGVVVGVVTGNDDPDELGRVTVRFPWLSASNESWWARVAFPGAGPDYGVAWIPQVDDEVLVAFEHGDLSHPIVIGGLWNGKDAAPLGSGLFDGGKVKRCGMISRRGHKFVFFDGDDKSGVALISSDGKLRLALKETDGEIHLVADGKVTIEARQDITVKSDMNVSIEAGAQLALKGTAGVKVESGATLDLDGKLITLN